MSSKIEWTEKTWNPITGCTKVSSGCTNCYAEAMSRRLRAMGVKGYEEGFKLNLRPERLDEPFNHKKPSVFFVNSMSDLFHNKVPFSYIDKVFDVIKNTPHHKYQILTKRAHVMEKYFRIRKVPKNAWLGVTVENKKDGIPRIKHLQSIDCNVRFLSIEPLLEDLGILDLSKLHWIIVGGESGSSARPMDKAWVNNIKKQCLHEDVSFFFKQWGTWGADNKKRSKKANGRLLDGKIWSQYPNQLNL